VSRSRRRRNGQALVEFALVAPVMFALMFAVFEVGFLMVGVMRAQNGIDVLTDLAANDPGWQSKVREEDERTGCNADPRMPTIEYLDDENMPLARVRGTWHCYISGPLFKVPIPVTVSSEAVTAKEAPSASPSPSPSP
jgi:hypothetical protein